MNLVLSKEEMAKAMADLSAKGRNPTLGGIHADLDHKIGGGAPSSFV
jgi:hypothetical protein